MFDPCRLHVSELSAYSSPDGYPLRPHRAGREGGTGIELGGDERGWDTDLDTWIPARTMGQGARHLEPSQLTRSAVPCGGIHGPRGPRPSVPSSRAHTQQGSGPIST
jgi:hypothetical protein